MERWVRALEQLPAMYPTANVGEVLPAVVELYVGRLSHEAQIRLLREVSGPLVADLLEILQGASGESRGSGGGSAGRPVEPAPGPAARPAGAAMAFPGG